MRLFRPFFPARLIFPEAIFRIETSENEVCLTFDDGPDPGSTPVILETLERYKIKAVFFCSGMNAEKYPLLMDLIISNGHTPGNHGFGHLNGWKTPVKQYTDDIMKAAGFTSTSLFRPPYGHLRLSQYKILKKYFKIVFWDLMTYDFDPEMDKYRSMSLLKKKVRPGSVIVFHDKPVSSVLSFLEEFLDFAMGAGYRFVIPDWSGRKQ